MDPLFDQKKLQELVLYQAIIHRSRTTALPSVLREKPSGHTGISLSPLELSPGVKRIFEKLQRQIFYHSDWWSVVHTDKGLIIDLLI